MASGEIAREAGTTTLDTINRLERRLQELEQMLQNVFRQGRVVATTSGESGASADPTGTVGLAVVNGILTSYMRSDAAPPLDQGIVPLWTGKHTFDSDIDLNTGVVESSVADGASARAYDRQDTIARTQGFADRLRNTADGKDLLVTTWDGRYAFGYFSTLAPEAGHILSFAQTDSESPTGAPHYCGIFALVTHNDSAETVPALCGVVGAAAVGTVTGLDADIAAGVTGAGIGSENASGYSAKTIAGVRGRLLGLSTPSIIEGDPDAPQVPSTILRGDYALAAALFGDYLAPSGAKALPANRPMIAVGCRAPIQGYCDSAGEQWGVYADAPTGGAPITPAIGGGLYCAHGPRGTRRLHAYFVPNASQAGGLSNNVSGDVYFDDGTNNRVGLHENDGTRWRKLLSQHEITTITNSDSPYTVTDEDDVVLCDTSSGAITVNLPALAARLEGKLVRIKKLTSDVNAVTIDASGSETIDDALTRALASQYDSVTLEPTASAWWIF